MDPTDNTRTAEKIMGLLKRKNRMDLEWRKETCRLWLTSLKALDEHDWSAVGPVINKALKAQKELSDANLLIAELVCETTPEDIVQQNALPLAHDNTSAALTEIIWGNIDDSDETSLSRDEILRILESDLAESTEMTGPVQ